MSCSVKSVGIALPLWIRPEEPGGGTVIGFCFGVWPFSHRIPREPLPSPVNTQDFPEDGPDVTEGVHLGEGAPALAPSSLSALILLFREERVMFQAEFEGSLEIQGAPLPPRDAHARLL